MINWRQIFSCNIQFHCRDLIFLIFFLSYFAFYADKYKHLLHLKHLAGQKFLCCNNSGFSSFQKKTTNNNIYLLMIYVCDNTLQKLRSSYLCHSIFVADFDLKIMIIFNIEYIPHIHHKIEIFSSVFFLLLSSSHHQLNVMTKLYKIFKSRTYEKIKLYLIEINFSTN